MRPNSIVKFEQFYLGALALGLVNGVLNWSNASEMLAADPNLAAMGPVFLVVTMAVGIGISLLLWYFAARKASVVAKWIITVLFGIGLISLLFSLGSLPVVNMVITGIVTLMQGYAVYMLFRPDAVAWFNGESSDVGSVFD